MNITIAFYIFELTWVTNLTLHKQFWSLEPNLPNTSIFNSRRKTWALLLNSVYSNYQVSHSTNNLKLWDLTSKKKIYLVKNRKNEHHLETLQIKINLSTKLQLKLCFFGLNLSKKDISVRKKQNWTSILNSKFASKNNITSWQEQNWTSPLNSAYSN